MQHPSFLMCPPTFFQCDYVINPWMNGNVGNVDASLASIQWQALHDVLSDLANISLIEPKNGSPDLVFTANAGLVVGQSAVVAKFAKKQRAAEEPIFREWFAKNNYSLTTPNLRSFEFEGAGDCLEDAFGHMWIGFGQRTNFKSAYAVANLFPNKFWHFLKLKNPKWYHLDTCFCPLSNGYCLYNPDAFDNLSEFKQMGHMAIPVSDEDAEHFACNAICINNMIIANFMSDSLAHKLSNLGFNIVLLPLTEFIKAGGSAKCLTLRIS